MSSVSRSILVVGIVLLFTTLGCSLMIWIDLRNQFTILNRKIDELISPPIPIPLYVSLITERMKVLVIESETRNRTLLFNSNQSYCKVKMFYGGDNPLPWDLAYPNDPIVFFFFEDIEDPAKTDNYSDLIVRMNRIKDKTDDDKLKCVIVFFAEGGYNKTIYGDDELLHHYKDDDPTSNYGIRMFDYDKNYFA